MAVLIAYMRKEAQTRRDMKGNPISEDILLYDDTHCLALFLDILNESDTAGEWIKTIARMGDEEGNHCELEYARDHVVNYLLDGLDQKYLGIVSVIREVLELACDRTNYWSGGSILGEYNPKYDETVARLCESWRWYDNWSALKADIESFVFSLI